MKKKNKVLLTSMATIAMSTSLLVGGTYALFTSESAVDIAVTSGKVAVSATVKDGVINAGDNNIGTASINEDGVVAIDRMMPNDEFSFDIEVKNSSNVEAYYRTVVETTEDNGLASALTVSFAKADSTEIAFMGGYGVDTWKLMNAADEDGEVVETITVTIKFVSQGDEADNKYNGDYSCKYQVRVEAVQGNTEVENPYDYENGIYYINNEEGMNLMNGIIGAVSHGEGRSLKFALTDDMDMTGIEWTPLDCLFVDIDGQNHTVSNLNCGIDWWGRSGFIGYAGGAVIKNITLENVTAEGSQAGIVAGSLEGATLENVKIAGTNSAKFNQLKNPEESWGGVGAIAGVASSVNTASTVEIVSGATVTVDYNGLLTGAPIQNEYAQISDISAIVTNNGTVTKIGEGLYGLVVSNDEELATAINAINTTESYWNKPVTVVMKEGTYTGDYVVKQNPAWDIATASTLAGYDKVTTLTFMGQGNVIMDGVFTVYGNGNGQGTPSATTAEGTTFKNITFTNTEMVDGTSYAAILEYGAEDVVFDNCIFDGPNYIRAGGNHAVGIYGLTLENCEFKKMACISGYVASVDVINCRNTGSSKTEGFINGQKGCTISITDSNLTVDGDYFVRTNSKGKVNIQNSTINSSFPLVWFRGTECSATFTGCTLNTTECVSSATDSKLIVDGVDLSDTFCTQIAKGFAMDVEGNYHVWTAQGLGAFHDAIEAKRNFNNTTVSLERDIDMTGTPWTTISRGHYEWGIELAGMIFDGKEHTISNMEITGSGMFDMLCMDGLVTFKNLTMDNVQAIEPAVAGGNQFKGVFVGHAYSDLAFNNVTVSNSKISGYWGIGAFVGMAGNENAVDLAFSNCHVENFTIDAPWNYYTSAFVGDVSDYATGDDTITFTGANTVTNFTVNALDGDGNNTGGSIYSDVSSAENVTVTGYTVNFQ